jgi:hypothetical protein
MALFEDFDGSVKINRSGHFLLRSERKQQLSEVKARLDNWRDARLVSLRIKAEKEVILEQEADVRLRVMKRLQDGEFADKTLPASVQKEVNNFSELLRLNQESKTKMKIVFLSCSRSFKICA